MKDRMSTESVELSISSVASKATYLGSGSTVLGWLVTSEAAVLIGILVTLAGFAVNLYYKRLDSQRKDEVLKADEARKAAREQREQAVTAAYIERMRNSSAPTAPAPLFKTVDDEEDGR